ncbi:hypothetical protein TCAL_16230 [Tigriopus californicus]|uniref:Myosin N-terminal SH3-like domain-containing protein n=1 Tax=Tigriopus californicus TaxID=6832 RepID=A0A553P2S5_TIGCA|nr:hypothetical protein TCAL_16230 [Tigriopus californicus]
MARILNYGKKKKKLMDREKVWVADPLEGFIRGNIVDLGEDTVTVEPWKRGKKLVVAPFDRLLPS